MQIDELFDLADEADRSGPVEMRADELRDLAEQLSWSKGRTAQQENQRLRVELNRAQQTQVSTQGRRFLAWLADAYGEHLPDEAVQRLNTMAGRK